MYALPSRFDMSNLNFRTSSLATFDLFNKRAVGLVTTSTRRSDNLSWVEVFQSLIEKASAANQPLFLFQDFTDTKLQITPYSVSASQHLNAYFPNHPVIVATAARVELFPVLGLYNLDASLMRKRYQGEVFLHVEAALDWLVAKVEQHSQIAKNQAAAGKALGRISALAMLGQISGLLG